MDTPRVRQRDGIARFAEVTAYGRAQALRYALDGHRPTPPEFVPDGTLDMAGCPSQGKVSTSSTHAREVVLCGEAAAGVSPFRAFMARIKEIVSDW